ncbi:hypothetical protein J3R83DRAFT_18 [Lanmaoa asiatica]|nr:hypothetical protein J3R83DRAFT_18 [Lanmaoa asiatica]
MASERANSPETPGSSLEIFDWEGSPPPTPSPASAQTSVKTSESEDLTEFFSGHFLPASLNDPKRNGPSLPQHLPQLPVNVTPVNVAKPVPLKVFLVSPKSLITYQDLESVDRWIYRNPDLIRLTGDHPFNCEAPLDKLFDTGFFTPAHLHYVRNHGAVPCVTEQMALEWTIQIHGLVQKEVTFTLQELSKRFPVVSIPVTLVCAGNRRKEQNTVRKTLGFDWGAAGVSTALWTGVYLADILEYVKPTRREAKYVVFEGGDILPKGPYGTSQRLSWAANKDRGMLIAWAMNGLPLEPDHGFPVRLIVPGQIGGRSVKWLTRIEISKHESQHHVPDPWMNQDNKILPTQVTVEQASKEDRWWTDPRFVAFLELNVNSAIAKPNHNDKITIDINFPERNVPSYTIQGYAYAGGGRRVTRVEVSLDEGQSWMLAEIEYPEDCFRGVPRNLAIYGALDLTQTDASFCWCFWSYEVGYDVLQECDAIMVRAMDESNALQQRDMYWHVLGMMNNWWFRVAVHKTPVSENQIELLFEHPTLAGRAKGGWMERMKTESKDIASPSFGNLHSNTKPNKPDDEPDVPLTKPGVDRNITLQELKDRDKRQPWFVVNDEVYDGTAYLNEHPGGGDVIVGVAGKDASEQFFEFHSPTAKGILATFHIGTLLESISQESVPADEGSNTNFLNQTWRTVELVKKEKVNHDSVLYRFALPKADQPLGLPVVQHVVIRLKRKDVDKVIRRPYTPVSREGAVGSIDFLIKLYLPSPEVQGGEMTTAIHQLLLGDQIDLSGPFGPFVWARQGVAKWRGEEREVKEIGLICGGSGITPILQVLRGIFDGDTNAIPKVWMISANKTEEDILCRSELDGLLAKHGSNHFKLRYILSNAPETWTSSRGRIDEKLLEEHMPRPSEYGLILACGPDGMISNALKPGLSKVGWDIDNSLVVF